MDSVPVEDELEHAAEMNVGDLETIKDPNEKAFMKAAASGNKKLLKELFKKKGLVKTVDVKNKSGQTALFCACFNEHLDTVVFLLEMGADPNSPSIWHHTPLHAGAFKGNIRIVSRLIEHGGDFRLHDSDGQTAKDWAMLNPHAQKRRDMTEYIVKTRMFAMTHSGRDVLLEKQSSLYMRRPTLDAGSLSMLFRRLSKVKGTRGSDKGGDPWPKSTASFMSLGYGKVYGGEKGGIACTIPLVAEAMLVHDEGAYTFKNGKFFVMEGMTMGDVKVTVKRLHRNPPKGAVVDLLIKEAENIGHLRHPHVLQLMAMCCTEDMEGLVLVFERTYYCSLHTYLYELKGKPQTHGATEGCLHIAEALLYLHQQGFIHCALSSHCIFLTNQNMAKLGNLEYMVPTVKGGESARKMDLSSHVYDKCLYNWMAPEVMEGSSPLVASDVFSFSSIMYEFYTGERPWGSSTPEEIYGHLCVKRMRLSVKDTRIPEALRSILAYTFAYDPNQREYNMVDIRDILFQMPVRHGQTAATSKRAPQANLPQGAGTGANANNNRGCQEDGVGLLRETYQYHPSLVVCDPVHAPRSPWLHEPCGDRAWDSGAPMVGWSSMGFESDSEAGVIAARESCDEEDILPSNRKVVYMPRATQSLEGSEQACWDRSHANTTYTFDELDGEVITDSSGKVTPTTISSCDEVSCMSGATSGEGASGGFGRAHRLHAQRAKASLNREFHKMVGEFMGQERASITTTTTSSYTDLTNSRRGQRSSGGFRSEGRSSWVSVSIGEGNGMEEVEPCPVQFQLKEKLNQELLDMLEGSPLLGDSKFGELQLSDLLDDPSPSPGNMEEESKEVVPLNDDNDNDIDNGGDNDNDNDIGDDGVDNDNDIDNDGGDQTSLQTFGASVLASDEAIDSRDGVCDDPETVTGARGHDTVTDARGPDSVPSKPARVNAGNDSSLQTRGTNGCLTLTNNGATHQGLTDWSARTGSYISGHCTLAQTTPAQDTLQTAAPEHTSCPKGPSGAPSTGAAAPEHTSCAKAPSGGPSTGAAASGASHGTAERGGQTVGMAAGSSISTQPKHSSYQWSQSPAPLPLPPPPPPPPPPAPAFSAPLLRQKDAAGTEPFKPAAQRKSEWLAREGWQPDSPHQAICPPTDGRPMTGDSDGRQMTGDRGACSKPPTSAGPVACSPNQGGGSPAGQGDRFGSRPPSGPVKSTGRRPGKVWPPCSTQERRPSAPANLSPEGLTNRGSSKGCAAANEAPLKKSLLGSRSHALSAPVLAGALANLTQSREPAVPKISLPCEQPSAEGPEGGGLDRIAFKPASHRRSLSQDCLPKPGWPSPSQPTSPGRPAQPASARTAREEQRLTAGRPLLTTRSRSLTSFHSRHFSDQSPNQSKDVTLDHFKSNGIADQPESLTQSGDINELISLWARIAVGKGPTAVGATDTQ